jgi:type VI secretion system secreted protein Hcp
MALNAYLTLKGQKQGDIHGSVTQKGREGKIMVIAADHELAAPRDPISGLATGQRVHKPFVITKELDAASPLLYSAMVTNENLSQWELQFWSPQVTAGSGVGSEVQRYTVRLTDASICDIRFRMLNNKNPELVRYAEYEEITFTYRRIDWIWLPGNLVAGDNWNTRA